MLAFVGRQFHLLGNRGFIVTYNEGFVKKAGVVASLLGFFCTKAVRGL